MRMTVVLAAMIAAVAIAPALADEASDARDHALYLLSESLSGAWSKDDTTKSWQVSGAVFDSRGTAKCDGVLADLTKLGAPGSSKVKVYTPGPDLAEGEHTLDDARAACASIVRAGVIRDWERWAMLARGDHAKLGKNYVGYVDTTYFERCLTAYETMLRKGITKDTKVAPQQSGDVRWEGTVEELRKKWCDAGPKVAQAERDKRDAPYKKVMKGEKLQMALLYRRHSSLAVRSPTIPIAWRARRCGSSTPSHRRCAGTARRRTCSIASSSAATRWRRPSTSTHVVRRA